MDGTLPRPAASSRRAGRRVDLTPVRELGGRRFALGLSPALAADFRSGYRVTLTRGSAPSISPFSRLAPLGGVVTEEPREVVLHQSVELFGCDARRQLGVAADGHEEHGDITLLLDRLGRLGVREHQA